MVVEYDASADNIFIHEHMQEAQGVFRGIEKYEE